MTSFDQPWRPQLEWSAPAGRVLDRLVAALPATRTWEIIVFGSSPLTSYCERAGLLKGAAEIYIEPCTVAAFTASPDWFVRAFRCARQHVHFTFPHPIDILVSKIKRLEEKDLRAYRLVREKTGHPNEAEMIQALQRVVDIFRPSFDEESAGNPAHNTQVLWRELFGKEIDVRASIITPALAERRRAYEQGGADWKAKLSGIEPSK